MRPKNVILKTDLKSANLIQLGPKSDILDILTTFNPPPSISISLSLSVCVYVCVCVCVCQSIPVFIYLFLLVS